MLVKCQDREPNMYPDIAVYGYRCIICKSFLSSFLSQEYNIKDLDLLSSNHLILLYTIQSCPLLDLEHG